MSLGRGLFVLLLVRGVLWGGAVRLEDGEIGRVGPVGLMRRVDVLLVRRSVLE
jgi:hypothetical protein